MIFNPDIMYLEYEWNLNFNKFLSKKKRNKKTHSDIMVIILLIVFF